MLLSRTISTLVFFQQPRKGKNKSESQDLTPSSRACACGTRRGSWGHASILPVMPNVAPDICDPTDTGNLISGSSEFSKSNLCIWKFLVHILLKLPFSSVQSLSCVQLFVTPRTAAHQASLPITNSSLLKLMSIVPVRTSNHLILCCPLPFLPSVFSSIRVFSNESALHIRWPKYWSFSFSISPPSEYSGLISLQSKGL